MKKILIIISIVILLGSLVTAGYLYLQPGSFALFSKCEAHFPKMGDRGPYFEGCEFVWECKQLSDQSSQERCYSYLARERGDQELCKKIKNETQKGYCNHFFEAQTE